MPQFAELHDGTRLEFPDGTRPEVIDRVVRQHLGIEEKKSQVSDDQRRADLGGGRLQMFNPASLVGIGPERFDLGVNLGQGTTEYLAGMGRRFMDSGTLGNRPLKDENADRLLDGSVNSALGGASADIASMMGGGAALRAFGGALTTAPMVGNAIKTIGQSLMMPKSVPQAIGGAAGYAAATTNGDAGDRAQAAALQGGVSGLVQGIPSALSRVLAPRGNPESNALRTSGIKLTPGQSMGGAANRMEEKAMSLPILGDAITSARKGSVESFNISTLNRALEPIGAKLPSSSRAGYEAIRAADDAIAAAYDNVIPTMTAKLERPLVDGVDAAERIAAKGNAAAQFRNIVGEELWSKFDAANALTGQTLKDVESTLKREARSFLNSQSQNDRYLGEALQAARDALMGTAGRHSPAGAAAELAKADKAYALFLRPLIAAGRQGSKEGVFTPAQLSSATRELAGGVRKSQYAKGNALMQDWAQKAEKVVGNKYPDSGTAGRIGLGAAALGLTGYGYDQGYVSPGQIGGLLALSALYAPGGQNLAQWAMRPSTNKLALSAAEKLQSAAPYSGLLGGAIGAPLLVNAP